LVATLQFLAALREEDWLRSGFTATLFCSDHLLQRRNGILYTVAFAVIRCYRNGGTAKEIASIAVMQIA